MFWWSVGVKCSTTFHRCTAEIKDSVATVASGIVLSQPGRRNVRMLSVFRTISLVRAAICKIYVPLASKTFPIRILLSMFLISSSKAVSLFREAFIDSFGVRWTLKSVTSAQRTQTKKCQIYRHTMIVSSYLGTVHWETTSQICFLAPSTPFGRGQLYSYACLIAGCGS